MTSLFRFPLSSKSWFLLLFDIFVLILALLVAFSMRLGEWYFPTDGIALLFLLAPVVGVPVFIGFGLYRAILRYIGFKALWVVIQAVSLYALLWGVLVLLSGVDGVVPRSVILINWMMATLLIGGSRMIARWWVADLLPVSNSHSSKVGRIEVNPASANIVIYGAGEAGFQLSSSLARSSLLHPVAFIDDASSTYGQHINGLEIFSISDLPVLIQKRNIKEVLLAIPSATHERKREIISQLEPYPVHVRTLPDISELVDCKVEVEDLREISIEDLLERDAVVADQELLSLNVLDKVVMVTGAGGSIGSELCRQIIALQPKQLILFDQSEHALYQIERELTNDKNANNENIEGNASNSLDVVAILGDISSQERIEQLCTQFQVQTVYHAAAYKHVPMVEKNIIEAVHNNIFGTLHCARAAINAEVESFVLISTDKAVRPTSAMGATKRFSELILQALSHQDDLLTRFTMVRFGNVLNSSGSVVPLFKEQIKHGGPVTVTDPNVIRYFMTIPEAAQLVIQAGALGQGGDVFVLDMGEPVRILDLARKMIHLSGLSVKDEESSEGDIEIVFTGLRPGEKLYEELLIGNSTLSTRHKQILTAKERFLPWGKVDELLASMQEVSLQGDQSLLRKLLMDSVPECNVRNDKVAPLI